MCHDSHSGKKWIYYGSNQSYSGIGWKKNMGWCFHNTASLYIGDFNGDSRDDMLCHDTNGNVFITYADRKGHFSKTGWKKVRTFCRCSGCQLFIGDFNGDGKSDMLCHDGKLGRKWIAYSTASGNFQNAVIWYRNMKWCYSSAGKLFVGDFNGDRRDDMYCYDDTVVKGNTLIAYAKTGGSFVSTDEADNMGWCLATGCTLSVASASKDRKDDLVCHCKNPSSEPISVRFPYNGGGFEIFRQWRRVRSWCNKSTEMLLVGRLKPGHCGSLVCIDKATGKYSIAFS